MLCRPSFVRRFRSRDRLAAAGYRVQGAVPSSRPARHPKHHRRRPVSVTTTPEAANEVSVPSVPQPIPEITAFDRSGEDAPKLTDKYRPRTLCEVLGQTEVVESLRRFVAAPYSCAMLFHGDSGIGKTSAAYALAHDLGCAVEEAELGGVFDIPSGSQTAESVRKILDLLRYRPQCGSGWRVLMVNECHRMALPVETIWLDALEHLPAKSVVIGPIGHIKRHRCRGNKTYCRPTQDVRKRRRHPPQVAISPAVGRCSR